WRTHPAELPLPVTHLDKPAAQHNRKHRQARSNPAATMWAVPLTAYLDAFSGISGDMLVGALADAGADPAAITDAIASLDINATVSFERVKRGGIAAMKFHVL